LERTLSNGGNVKTDGDTSGLEVSCISEATFLKQNWGFDDTSADDDLSVGDNLDSA
jgi:hypothetical protein